MSSEYAELPETKIWQKMRKEVRKVVVEVIKCGGSINDMYKIHIEQSHPDIQEISKRFFEEQHMSLKLNDRYNRKVVLEYIVRHYQYLSDYKVKFDPGTSGLPHDFIGSHFPELKQAYYDYHPDFYKIVDCMEKNFYKDKPAHMQNRDIIISHTISVLKVLDKLGYDFNAYKGFKVGSGIVPDSMIPVDENVMKIIVNGRTVQDFSSVPTTFPTGKIYGKEILESHIDDVFDKDEHIEAVLKHIVNFIHTRGEEILIKYRTIRDLPQTERQVARLFDLFATRYAGGRRQENIHTLNGYVQDVVGTITSLNSPMLSPTYTGHFINWNFEEFKKELGVFKSVIRAMYENVQAFKKDAFTVSNEELKNSANKIFQKIARERKQFNNDLRLLTDIETVILEELGKYLD